MKKLLIVFLSLITLILAAAVVIPIIFKDDIKAAIDEELAKAVNAEIIFDADDFSISLFTNFPSLTVEVRNFGVVNRAPFEGQKLMGMESLQVEVNLKSVLIDDDMRLKGVSLNRPEIFVTVLKDGTANYDIAVASEDVVIEEEVADESVSAFAFAIDHWAINNAVIVYDDHTLPFKLELNNLTHTGSGTFSETLFDMTTKTTVDTVNVAFDGTEYMSNKKLDIDLILAISDNYGKYTFKENTIRVNDFALGFDGYLAMLEDGFDMDLTYASKDNSFKSLLSLVPGAYLEGFEAVKTAGSLSFGGAVKGQFNDNQMPAFNLNLEVADAMFQYPDLPTAATDINIKTLINNADGVIDHTTVDVSQFHINLGGNPFDATLKVSELNDVNWDLKVDGLIDLNNVAQIMPMAGTTLAGIINMNMQSSGKLSLVESEQYEQLTTNGSLKVSDLKYTDEAFAYDIALNKVEASFDPKEINLSSFDAVIGKSDMQMTGIISNYIAYALDSTQVLKGQVNFSSTMLDLDEFIPEDEEGSAPTEVVAEDTTSLSVIPIPANIDFALNSKIGTTKMMDMAFTNAVGDIIIKDGVANLSDLQFNSLGGQFIVNGSYHAKDIENPVYDFKLKIKEISISESFQAFSMVQQYVPLAENMIGNVSTEFDITGKLKSDMMPNFESINAAGLLNVAKAALEKPKFLADLGNVTKLSGSKLGGPDEKVSLKDVLMSVTIKDGDLSVKPFDISIGDYTANVSGTSSVDGKLNYKMDLDIPAGALGSQVNSLLSKYTGSGNSSSTITLPIGIGGTYDNPTYGLVGGGAQQQATTAVKEVVVDKAKEVVKENLDAEKAKQREKIMSEAQKQADNLKAEGKKSADKVRQEGYDQADKLVKDAGSNFLKKKLAQEASKKLKTTTDNKAKAIEDEANKKADTLLANAKKRADAV
jgi:hypothetical protein